jgi:inner membrane organizing system protein 1
MASRAPELTMDAKWEAAIDLTLRRLVYGSLAGGAAGLVLFRECPSEC